MKKLLLLALLLCGIMQAWADEWTDNNGIRWIFYVSGSNATSIYPSDKSSISGDVVIPSKVYKGETELTVTSIGTSAFYGCSGLTSVTIPEGVMSIGDWAFCNCSGLMRVSINATNVPSLGNTNSLPGPIVVLVPESALDDYLAADVWKDMTDRITTISPYNDFFSNCFRSRDLLGSSCSHW